MKVQFGRINFRMDTLTRFRSFSKTHGKTHSDVLEDMMDFFTKYQMSPFQDFGPNIMGMETNIKRRINALIAIVKDIEKHGVNPTKAMMEILFEHAPQQRQQKSLSSDKQDMPIKDDAFFKTAFEAIEMQKQNTILKQNLDKVRQRFIETLDKVEINKSRFGQTKLQLNMTLEEYNNLESTLKQSRHCTTRPYETAFKHQLFQKTLSILEVTLKIIRLSMLGILRGVGRRFSKTQSISGECYVLTWFTWFYIPGHQLISSPFNTGVCSIYYRLPINYNSCLHRQWSSHKCLLSFVWLFDLNKMSSSHH